MSDTPKAADRKDGEFSEALAALQKASETSRAMFSAFFVIYSAIVMFALSAFVVPNEQDRIHSLSQDLTGALPCIFLDSDKHPDMMQSCEDDFSTFIMSPRAFQAMRRELAAPDQPRFTDIVQHVNTEVFSHRVMQMLDVSNDVSRFSIPIVGIKIDRNWFGYMNVVAGVFFYFIVLHALENQIVMLCFVRAKAAGNLLRLHVISTTQVLTSSGRFPRYLEPANALTGATAGAQSALMLPSKKLLFTVIIAFPLFVAATVEWDTVHILWPQKVPGVANVLTWLGSPAADAVSALFPGKQPIGEAVWTPVQIKEHLLFSFLLAFNSIGIMVLLLLFGRLRRRISQLFWIDDTTMAEIDRMSASEAEYRRPRPRARWRLRLTGTMG